MSRELDGRLENIQKNRTSNQIFLEYCESQDLQAESEIVHDEKLLLEEKYNLIEGKDTIPMIVNFEGHTEKNDELVDEDNSKWIMNAWENHEQKIKGDLYEEFNKKPFKEKQKLIVSTLLFVEGTREYDLDFIISKDGRYLFRCISYLGKFYQDCNPNEDCENNSGSIKNKGSNIQRRS